MSSPQVFNGRCGPCLDEEAIGGQYRIRQGREGVGWYICGGAADGMFKGSISVGRENLGSSSFNCLADTRMDF